MTTKLLTLLFVILFTGCFSNDKASDENISVKSVEKVSKELSSESSSPQNAELNSTSTKVKKREDNASSLFTLKTIKGKSINIDELEGGLKLHEFKDKAVLLVLFGHQCPPCLAEIPALIELTKEGHKDLDIIAIEVQGLNDERLEAFAKSKGINYNLVSAEKNREFIGYIATKSGWSGAIPFLLGMDTKGVVQVVHTGGLGKAQLDTIYDELKTK